MSALPAGTTCATPNQTLRRRPPVARRLEFRGPFHPNSLRKRRRPRLLEPLPSKEATMHQTWCPSGEPLGFHASDTLELVQESQLWPPLANTAPRCRDKQRSKGAWPHRQPPERDQQRDFRGCNVSNSSSLRLPRETKLLKAFQLRATFPTPRHSASRRKQSFSKPSSCVQRFQLLVTPPPEGNKASQSLPAAVRPSSCPSRRLPRETALQTTSRPRYCAANASVCSNRRQLDPQLHLPATQAQRIHEIASARTIRLNRA